MKSTCQTQTKLSRTQCELLLVGSVMLCTGFRMFSGYQHVGIGAQNCCVGVLST